MNLRNLLVSAAVATATLAAGSAAMAAAPNTQTATVNGSANIIRPITISAAGTLDFGTIVKPRSGGAGGTVIIGNAQTASRTPSGDLVLVGGAFSRPVYTIGGEGGQNYSLVIPTSFNMAGSAGGSLTVTLNPSMTAGSNSFTGAIGSAASATLYMGASIPVDENTTSGAYSGSFDVTVTYN